MRFLKLIASIVLLGLSVTFIVQNPWIYEAEYSQSLKFINQESIPIRLAILFIIVFFLGIFLSALCYIIKNSKLKKQLKAKQKNISQMEKELNSLRNLPITETSAK